MPALLTYFFFRLNEILYSDCSENSPNTDVKEHKVLLSHLNACGFPDPPSNPAIFPFFIFNSVHEIIWKPFNNLAFFIRLFKLISVNLQPPCIN